MINEKEERRMKASGFWHSARPESPLRQQFPIEAALALAHVGVERPLAWRKGITRTNAGTGWEFLLENREALLQPDQASSEARSLSRQWLKCEYLPIWSSGVAGFEQALLNVRPPTDAPTDIPEDSELVEFMSRVAVLRTRIRELVRMSVPRDDIDPAPARIGQVPGGSTRPALEQGLEIVFESGRLAPARMGERLGAAGL